MTLSHASAFSLLRCTCWPSVLWTGSSALITPYSLWMHRLVYTHHNKLQSPPSPPPHVVVVLCVCVCVHTTTQVLLNCVIMPFSQGDMTASQHMHKLFTTTHQCDITTSRRLRPDLNTSNIMQYYNLEINIADHWHKAHILTWDIHHLLQWILFLLLQLLFPFLLGWFIVQKYSPVWQKLMVWK